MLLVFNACIGSLAGCSIIVLDYVVSIFTAARLSTLVHFIYYIVIATYESNKLH